MSENNQARIGMGIPAAVSPVLADMEIRDLKDRLAAVTARAERLEAENAEIRQELIAIQDTFSAARDRWESERDSLEEEWTEACRKLAVDFDQPTMASECFGSAAAEAAIAAANKPK